MSLTTGAQLRAGRALARLDKEALAKLSGVSSTTLRKFEAVDGTLDARTSTLRALEAVLTARGVEFKPDGSVRLRDPASGPATAGAAPPAHERGAGLGPPPAAGRVGLRQPQRPRLRSRRSRRRRRCRHRTGR